MVDIWNTADYIDFRWFTIARDNYKRYLICWVFLIEPLLLEGHIFPLLHWGYFYFVLTSDRCSILDTFTNRQSWSHSKYVLTSLVFYTQKVLLLLMFVPYCAWLHAVFDFLRHTLHAYPSIHILRCMLCRVGWISNFLLIVGAILAVVTLPFVS